MVDEILYTETQLELCSDCLEKENCPKYHYTLGYLDGLSGGTSQKSYFFNNAFLNEIENGRRDGTILWAREKEAKESETSNLLEYMRNR